MKKHLYFLLACIGLCNSMSAQLSEQEAADIKKQVISEWKAQMSRQYDQAYQEHIIRRDDLTLPLGYIIRGEEPQGGRSLWISMHGGGNTTKETNDQQWENQIYLYSPQGIYVAPRAPWDDWDMWFKAPIDSLFQDLITMMIVKENINPDKVYILGYSAGGDGVWRLAPRLADHWAAASMMAGHPGDVGLRNLVNTPFMMWVGALDSAYDRNLEVQKRGVEMDSLSQTIPNKYIHQTNIVAGKSHWMDQTDTAAISWMNKYTRDAHPKQIIWTQEECLRKAFYWVSLPSSITPKRGNTFDARIENNTIFIDQMDYQEITIWLDDDMVDLSLPITIQYNGKIIFKQQLDRTQESMKESIYERKDPSFCFPANVTINKDMTYTDPEEYDEPIQIERLACDSTWYTGEGTQYGGIAGSNGGNCGIFVEEGDFYHCAMNHIQYDSSYACGACVKVQGPIGEITVKVVDRCPECKMGDIDFSTDAFTTIAKLEDGRVPIKWRFVPCEENKNIKVLFEKGTSPFYFKALFYDIKYRIKSIEYKRSDGTYAPIHREMYNYFVEQKGIDENSSQCGPYSFRLTDEHGDVVYVENVKYEAGVEIDLGVQFPKSNCGDESFTNEIENTLLWSDDIQKIEVYDLLGRIIFTTTQREEYLAFSQRWDKLHLLKLYFEKFSKVEIRK